MPWMRIGLSVLLTAGLAGLAWVLLDPAATRAPAVQAASPKPPAPPPITAPPPPPRGTLLVDATDEAGLTFRQFGGVRGNLLVEDMGTGIAIADVDGDGDLDVYAVATNAASAFRAREGLARNALFRNRGDGTFEEVGEAAGVAFSGIGMASVFADIDGDGDQDLLVTNFGPDRLFRNRGDGTFEDASVEVGLTDPGFSAGAAFGDVDGDGDLDLYLARYVRFDLKAGPAPPTKETERRPPTPAVRKVLLAEDAVFETPPPYALLPVNFRPVENRLLLNDGGRFTNAPGPGAAADPEGRSLQPVLADLDGDGQPDIFVANDISYDRLFLGRGRGTFGDASNEAGVLSFRGAMGVGVDDFDGDGRLDLFVSNYSTDRNALWLQRPINGRLRFASWEGPGGVGDTSLGEVGWGVSTADLDLDGHADLVIANGHIRNLAADPRRLGPQRDRAFRNLGEATFEDRTSEWLPPGQPRVTRGLAAADLDGDGDEDLLLMDHGHGLRYLRNDQPGHHHWLKILLDGPRGNPTGVGARVTVRAGDRTRTRPLLAGASYLSDHGPELVFGLGKATAVDEILVRWPGGGETRVVPRGVDQVLRVAAPSR